MHHYYVYILGNVSRIVLYIGVTNNLLRRLGEHQSGLFEGFTNKYQIHDLLYFEEYDSPNQAIVREKQLKSWSRKRKDKLITTRNPSMRDLSKDILEQIATLRSQ